MLQRLFLVFQSPTFRIAWLSALGVGAVVVVLFAFIFWQTSVLATARADDVLVRDAGLIATEGPDEIVRSVKRRVAGDFRRIVLDSIFDADGRYIAGNLQMLPPDLAIDGRAHRVHLDEHCCDTFIADNARVLAYRLGDGRILVIGRNIDALDIVRQTVTEALEWGVIPALVLALLAGAWFAKRAQSWMESVEASAQRIERGDVWHRLPVPGTPGETRQLVQSVNRVLDRMSTVVDSARAGHIHMAHDLLSPLSGVRARLEQGTETATSVDELQEIIGRAVTGLDHALGLASAFLKVSAIERGHLRQHFTAVSLNEIVDDIGSLYAPLADEKRVAFHTLDTAQSAVVSGDRDLLMEAVANLVDNALKYTPPGGVVTLSLTRDTRGLVIGVRDTGPGVGPENRQVILERFQRLAQTSDARGYGLGLSLVDAVVRLHSFGLALSDGGPGLRIEIVCVSTS